MSKLEKATYPAILSGLMSRPVNLQDNILAKYDQDALPYLLLLRFHLKDLPIHHPADIDLKDYYFAHLYRTEPGVYRGYLAEKFKDPLLEFKDQTLPIIASLIASKIGPKEEVEEVENPIETNEQVEPTVAVTAEKNSPTPKGVKVSICPEGSINIEVMKSLQEKDVMKDTIELLKAVNQQPQQPQQQLQMNGQDPNQQMAPMEEENPVKDDDGHEYIRSTDHEGGKQYWYRDPETGKYIEKENAPEGHEDFDHTPMMKEVMDQIATLADEVLKLKQQTQSDNSGKEESSKDKDGDGKTDQKTSLKEGVQQGDGMDIESESKKEVKKSLLEEAKKVIKSLKKKYPTASNEDIIKAYKTYKSKHRDQLPGGLADKKKPADFDQQQLQMGIKVELEHTDDKAKAKEIAMDHLTEDPKYYSHLKEMEDKNIKKASEKKEEEKEAKLGKDLADKVDEIAEGEAEEAVEEHEKKMHKKEVKKAEDCPEGEVMMKKQGVPEGVDPVKHERCVKEVKKQGKDKASAYAICNASMKKAKPKGVTDEDVDNICKALFPKKQEIPKLSGPAEAPDSEKKKWIYSDLRFLARDLSELKNASWVICDELPEAKSAYEAAYTQIKKQIKDKLDELNSLKKSENREKKEMKKSSRLQRMWKVFKIEMPEDLKTKQDVKDAHNGAKILKSKIVNQGKEELEAENIVRNTLKEKYGDLFKSVVFFKESIQQPEVTKYVNQIEKSKKLDAFTVNEEIEIRDPYHMYQLRQMDSDNKFNQPVWQDTQTDVGDLQKTKNTDLNDRIKKSMSPKTIDWSDKGFKAFNEDEVKKAHNKETETDQLIKARLENNWGPTSQDALKKVVEADVDRMRGVNQEIDWSDMNLSVFNEEIVKKSMKREETPLEKSRRKQDERVWGEIKKSEAIYDGGEDPQANTSGGDAEGGSMGAEGTFGKGGPGSGRKQKFMDAHKNLSPQMHKDSQRKLSAKMKKEGKNMTVQQLEELRDKIKWHGEASMSKSLKEKYPTLSDEKIDQLYKAYRDKFDVHYEGKEGSREMRDSQTEVEGHGSYRETPEFFNEGFGGQTSTGGSGYQNQTSNLEKEADKVAVRKKTDEEDSFSGVDEYGDGKGQGDGKDSYGQGRKDLSPRKTL